MGSKWRALNPLTFLVIQRRISFHWCDNMGKSTVYLTTRQAGRRLGISDSRVRKLILEGRIRATKVGAYNLIREVDCHYAPKRNYPKGPRQLHLKLR